MWIADELQPHCASTCTSVESLAARVSLLPSTSLPWDQLQLPFLLGYIITINRLSQPRIFTCTAQLKLPTLAPLLASPIASTYAQT